MMDIVLLAITSKFMMVRAFSSGLNGGRENGRNSRRISSRISTSNSCIPAIPTRLPELAGGRLAK
jgi:hypothetical protein